MNHSSLDRLRDEGARNALIEPVGAAKQGKKEQQRAAANPEPGGRALIEPCAGVESVIEPFEENAFAPFAMFPRKTADSAGVRVSALKAEIETENAMVSANCRKRIPVVPGRARPHEYRPRERRSRHTAPATSFIATEAALCGSVMALDDVPLHILNHHDGVVHHQPGGQRDPNSVSVLIEKPSNFTKTNVPISETGMVIAGMNVLLNPAKTRK